MNSEKSPFRCGKGFLFLQGQWTVDRSQKTEADK
nr:MAG TPA: hypothetical protein [Caudoviricetes sp.]